MGVYIKGMEMPKACVYRENGSFTTCPLYDIDGYCGALNTEASHNEGGKLSDCPLSHVPPHGRLGDLNELAKVVLNWITTQEKAYPNEDSNALSWRLGARAMGHQIYRDIEAAPTIIPAEEVNK